MTDANSIPLNPDDDGGDPLRRTLRRCSRETYEAALEYRRTRSPACLAPITAGILARYAAPEARVRLSRPEPTLRLVEDLGLDSLDKIQAAMVLEDVLQLTINDRSLMEMNTFGDVLSYLNGQVASGEPVNGTVGLQQQSAMA
jgi:acyl carrier protein